MRALWLKYKQIDWPLDGPDDSELARYCFKGEGAGDFWNSFGQQGSFGAGGFLPGSRPGQAGSRPGGFGAGRFMPGGFPGQQGAFPGQTPSGGFPPSSGLMPWDYQVPRFQPPPAPPLFPLAPTPALSAPSLPFAETRRRGGGGNGGNGGGAGDGGGGGGGGACCFTAGTLVRMADGTTLPIVKVNIGDRVRGKDRINEVIGIDAPLLENRPLIGFNDSDPFTTWDHPFWDGETWRCVKPDSRASTSDLHVEKLNVGDRIVTEDGDIVLAQIARERADTETQLYDLKLDGDHTYFANGYLAHNCLAGGLVREENMGPDVDGYGGDDGTLPMKSGEYVIRQDAVKALGLHTLKLLNLLTRENANEVIPELILRLTRNGNSR